MILGTANSVVNVDTQVSSTCPQDPTIDSTTKISEVSAKSLDPIQDDVNLIEIKKEVTEDFPVVPDHIKKIHSNKIILGKNPSSNEVSQEQFSLINQGSMKVLLYNIYSYLKNSGRYCHQCLILFPDKITFDSHRNLMHNKACYKIKDSCPYYKCGKKFNYSDLQCHLRHVHQIKMNKQVQLKKTWNSHTEKFGKQVKMLKTANASKDNKEKEKIKKWLTINKSMRINLNQQIDETAIKNKIKTETCRRASSVSRNSLEMENSSYLPGILNMGTESSINHTCFHCDMIFGTQKSLIEHLYTIMHVKNIDGEKKRGNANSRHKRVHGNATKNVIHIKNANTKRSINTETKKTNILNNFNPSKFETSMNFKCDVCSFYFNSSKLCSRHLIMKHGIISKELKKKPFVPNCVFCLKKMANIEDYNSHILDVHQIKYTKKLINTKQISGSEVSFVFALKSALFKCMQCDIHFLSANAAQRHAEHMELLINWKCNKCNRIFKKNDEFLHEKQHTFSNTFTVHDLSASALSRVLYNCSKCAIHFAEEQFLKHYPICGIETPIATYCKNCDILIDEDTIKSHAMIHSQKEPVHFITIDADIILTKHERSEVRRRKSIQEAETSTMKTKHDMVDIFNLFHCDICNSFLNKQDYYIHVRAQCVNLEKKICKICGLIFTNRNYSIHKNLHSKLGFLKVQDFTFCEVKTKKQICPPTPEYLKCNFCKVIFISQFVLLSHECSDENYLTCHICEDKLSDNAFKLHMSFHYYSITNILKDSQHETDLLIKEKSPNYSPYLKKEISCTLGLSKLSDVRESKSDLSFVKSPQAPYPLTSFNSGIKTSSETYGTQNKLSNINCNIDICGSKLPMSSTKKFTQSSCSTTTKIQRKKCNVEMVPIIYSCKTCGITVDTYDKVIEHCQSHYEDNETTIDTEDSYCPECDLKFDKSCHESHEKLHQDKTFFKHLKFDTFYFTFDNNTWIRHIFGSMPQSLIDQIVNKSIYKSECRVKMQLLQDGPPNLTVFQCDKCQCFIDQSAIYKHADNSCFKLRNHPCTFCGLPFNSSNTQIAHQKIHETANITVMSYRIVTFNKNEDRKFNNVLYNQTFYTLYQCRNCDGTTVKSQIMNHKCNVYSLKKCLKCGLLLCGAEFENHMLRHKELSNFIPNNMKVIMFGDKIESSEGNANKMKSSYCGIIYDYLYYRCSKCQVCMKNKNFSAHVCSLEISRMQCSECDLYFLNTKFKSHLKMHNDPDFNPENVKVVTFDPPLHSELTDSTHFDLYESDNKILKSQNNVIRPDELTWKVAKIYKCACGLNFLDAISVSTHIKCCNPKIRTSKQKCSKCDLLFTPNILFSHLLTHHGNKKHKYKFEIIDLTCETNLTNILYRCRKCKLHFVKGIEASTHLLDCKGRNLGGKQCNYCNLLFNEVCFNIHFENHCKASEFDNKIYEIKKCTIPLVKVDEANNKEKNINLHENLQMLV